MVVAVGYGAKAAEDHLTFVTGAREYKDDGRGSALLDAEGQPIPADLN